MKGYMLNACVILFRKRFIEDDIINLILFFEFKVKCFFLYLNGLHTQQTNIYL